MGPGTADGGVRPRCGRHKDVLEATARQNGRQVLGGTGVVWEFAARTGDPAHELWTWPGDSEWHQADTALPPSTDQAIDAIFGERIPE
jgi:hypothetical protein